MADVPARSMTDAELAAIFSTLENLRADTVMLAVSGGTDSLALLNLYARFHRLDRSPPRVLVATLDHGLRPESAAEAAFVAREAHRAGFAHETLLWEGEKPATGRQQAARSARYRLMAQRLAREPGTRHALVTAHTQDDQAETLVMRLARGSGLDGLAGMTPVRVLEYGHDIFLVRPLLGVSRAQLAAVLNDAGLTPVVDPSNADHAYERVRTRAALADLNRLGVSHEALARSANRLARAKAAIEAQTDSLEASAGAIVAGVSTTLVGQPFWSAPAEIRVRLLARALERHRGVHPAARLSEVENALDRLETGAEAKQAACTLGGCIIVGNPASVRIFREVGRDGLGEIVLQPGDCAVWDGRFVVGLAQNAGSHVTVRSIPPETWARAQQAFGRNLLPARIAQTLPSFWYAGEVLAIPDVAALLKGTRHTDCIQLPGDESGGPVSAHGVGAGHCNLRGTLQD